MISRYFKFLIGLAVLLTITSIDYRVGAKLQDGNVSPELMEYVVFVDDFIHEAGVKISSQPIKITLVDKFTRDSGQPFWGNVIAIAMGMWNDGYIEIEFSRAKFMAMNDYHRRWTMLHEVMHDAFNIKHSSTLIMKPSMERGDDYYEYEKALKEAKDYLRLYYN